MTMKIGFIGLGIMGKPMAKNLIKAGHELTVFNRSRAAVDDVVAFSNGKAKAADQASDVAKSAELVLTMLPNSPHVKSVMLEDGKVADFMEKGAAFIDMSSINPIASREIADALAKKGIEMLDAPVSGGEPKAIDGTLSFMVGGKPEVFAKFKPVLEAMGSSVVLCGEVGAGNVTKLCNQAIVAINIAAVSEALMLGKKAGVDPEAIYQAIRGGLAGSTVMDAKAPMIMDRNFKPGFRIDLHIKDLNNVMDAAKSVDSPIPLTAQVFEMMKILHADGKGQNDHSAIAQFYEKMVNTEIVRG
ncbi:MAG: 2-hydroxy-3-oxopropionate reductase [Synergistaceae bacterium]|nr:2-hydroxy-3-oxopropionate reductase [Synergistaceae bacterium]MBQ6665748.1 2-hydroxy-3-oxopropionate reductase [Synergistaceae bacterium]